MQIEKEDDIEEDIEDIQERIENLENLTKENNKILQKIRSTMRMGTLMSVLYWTFIIGSMVGAYYYLQPFMRPILDTYDQLITIPDKMKGLN